MTLHEVFLKNKKIKSGVHPYIIAEIGVNHEGSISNAKKLIEAAARGGAHAAKFQTYKAEKIASVNSPYYWDLKKEKSKNQFELFKRYDSFNAHHYKELYNHCIKNKIDFLSTPFDVECLKFLDPLLNFYKIASADINNIPLLKAVANKNKPVVLSTGASTIEEISFSIKYLEEKGCPNISILHCVLNYPTQRKNANLNIIRNLKKNFLNNVVGYSDHTLPDKTMSVLKLAFLYGAKIIEKHFTLDKTLPGNDHYHAMDENDLKTFIKEINEINELSGNKEKQVLKSEEISRKNARRSIVIKNQILKGAKIKEKDIISKRPGTGISSVEWENVLGKEVKHDLKKDHILQYTDLKK